MNNILLSFAVTIASSVALTSSSSSQCYLGINPEHMSDFINNYGDSATSYNARNSSEPVIKFSYENLPATIYKNGFLSSDNLHLSEFSDMYSQNGNIHYSVFYRDEKASANTENVVDYPALSAAEFLVLTFGSRPSGWYITRMTVVLK
ncbi:MAG: hypothetical protein ABIN89_04610 [Chitinophagaceae bacterium]